MVAETAAHLDSIRDRVRAAQHARSFPLLVLGVLFVNYGVGRFLPSPMPWRYAAPLAFVLVWALFKVNESKVGVGARTDYLVAAGFVFAATGLTMLRPFTNHLRSVARAEGIWTAIVGVALLGLARAGADRLLLAAGAAITAVGAFVFVVGTRWSSDASLPGIGLFPEQPWTEVVIAVLGLLLVAAGMLAYRRERIQA
jgi:hypothetical protein